MKRKSTVQAKRCVPQTDTYDCCFKGYILLMKRHMLYKVHEMEVMQSAYLPENCTHTKIIDSSSITAFKNLKIYIL